MAKTPAVVAGGLVRRYIQLRSGTRAWRMVRPDNPNIIDPQPEEVVRRVRTPAAVEAPQQEERPAVVVKSEKADPKRRFKDMGYQSCCGGSFLVGEPVGVKPDPRVEALRAWKQAGYENNVKSYESQIAAWKKNLEDFEAGKKDKAPYGWTKAHLLNSIRIYEGYVKRYDFETMYAAGQLKDTGFSLDLKTYKGPGVTVSCDMFHLATKTPAGIFVRDDYPLGDYSGTPVKIPEPSDTPSVDRTKKINTNKYYPRSYEQVLPDGTKRNVWTLSGMSSADLANEIASGIAGYKEMVVGDVVTFILNKPQMTKAKAAKLTQAGYRCVLITSNKSHSGSSILYLFERELTEVDKPNG